MIDVPTTNALSGLFASPRPSSSEGGGSVAGSLISLPAQGSTRCVSLTGQAIDEPRRAPREVTKSGASLTTLALGDGAVRGLAAVSLKCAWSPLGELPTTRNM